MTGGSEILSVMNQMGTNNMVGNLGIQFIDVTENSVTATMPVDERTKQPMGLLHGGATVALAETIGSMGSSMMVDLKTKSVMGIEVNANHLKAVSSGTIMAVGTIIHKGRTTHVWDIRVMDEQGNTTAICRITNLVVDKRQ